jgi:isoleucyl-tRNA synthetase
MEGIAREVVRRIQTMRKDMDLEYDARISLKISGDAVVVKGIQAFKEYIMHETLADSMTIDDDITDGKNWDIDQGHLRILIV